MFDKVRRILIVSTLFYGWHLPVDVAKACAQTDQVQAQFVGSGHEGGSFPITTAITRVQLNGDGVIVTTTPNKLSPPDPNGWPWTCGNAHANDPGDCVEGGSGGNMGALIYSLGMVLQINGQWYASAPIESYKQAGAAVGGEIQDYTCCNGAGQILGNWFYDGRWAPLNTAPKPGPGTQVGIFVMAGDARNNFYVVRERSNIVLVTLPAAGANADFSFAQSGPPNVTATVAQVKAQVQAAGIDINHGPGECGRFEITKRVAWTLRDQGAGLVAKFGAQNGCSATNTTSEPKYAVDAIVIGGHIVDILGGGGDGNTPQSIDDGPDTSNLFRPPFDPGSITPPPPPPSGCGTPANPCQGPAGPPGPQGPQGPQGEPGAGADPAVVQDLQNQINALKLQLQNLKIPTGCKASINIGTKIGIHCELTY